MNHPKTENFVSVYQNVLLVHKKIIEFLFRRLVGFVVFVIFMAYFDNVRILSDPITTKQHREKRAALLIHMYIKVVSTSFF